MIPLGAEREREREREREEEGEGEGAGAQVLRASGSRDGKDNSAGAC